MNISQIDFCLKGFRWQIVNQATGEPEGRPYLYMGRCWMRVFKLNAEAGDYVYSLRPIRSHE